VLPSYRASGLHSSVEPNKLWKLSAKFTRIFYRFLPFAWTWRYWEDMPIQPYYSSSVIFIFALSNVDFKLILKAEQLSYERLSKCDCQCLLTVTIFRRWLGMRIWSACRVIRVREFHSFPRCFSHDWTSLRIQQKNWVRGGRCVLDRQVLIKILNAELN